MMARVIVCVAIAGAALVVSPLAQVATAQSRAAPAAASGLSECLRRTDRLLVLMLLDESGSLGGPKGTDPDAVRVAAAKAALGGLETLAGVAVDGRRPLVEVAAAGFSTQYRESVPWTAVNAQTVSGLRDALDSFRERNRGRDTDYAAALEGAAASLRGRAASLTADGGRAPCLALIWFTDGRYDIEGPGGDAAVDAGIARLCGGGFVDGMRQSGIVDFVVALAAPQSNLSPADEAFLRGVATGAQPSPCGSRGNDRTGLFLPASGADDLVLLFGNLFSDPQPLDPCPAGAPPCAGTFRIGPATGAFRLLATLDRADVTVELVNPLGATQPLNPTQPSDTTLGTAQIHQPVLSDRALEVMATFPSAETTDWVGTWTVRFRSDDPAGGSFTVAPVGRFAPHLVGKPHLSIGESRDLTIELVDAQGRPARTGPALDEAEVTAVVRAEDGTAIPLKVSAVGDGRFRTSYTTPVDSTATELTIETSVAYPSGPDSRLAPVSRQYGVPVDLPEVFPRIEPRRLDLPSRRGTAAQRATMTITGSAVAKSCVWISGSRVKTPQGMGPLEVSSTPAVRSRQRCLAVPRGAIRRLELELTPEHDGSGVVSGTVALGIDNDRTGDVRVVRVPVSYFVEPSPSATTAWAVFLALLALCLAIPFVVPYVLNVRWARFSRLDLLRVARVPVVVDPSTGVSRTEAPAGSPVLAPEDFEVVGGSAEPRQFVVADLRFDAYPRGLGGVRRARKEEDPASRRGGRHVRDVFRAITDVILTGPFGEVRSVGTDTPIVAAAPGKTLRSRDEGRVHEVPLALPGSWLFVLDPEADAGEASPIDQYFPDQRPAAPQGPSPAATTPDGASDARSGVLVAFVLDGGGVEQFEELRTNVVLGLPGLAAAMPHGDATTQPPQDDGGRRRPRRGRRPRRAQPSDSAPDVSDDPGDPTGGYF